MEELNVLYEDNHIIVVLKPQNVPTQEDESKDLDMLNMVKNYIKVKYDKPGNVYVGLVHRLDRPTGGVMVFAKTSKAAGRLGEQIKNGEMSKRYLAVLDGKPKQDGGKLINYLAKNEKTNTVLVVPQLTHNAKYAELKYKILDSNEQHSLVDVDLVTGRSHQIRVQMKHIGCSIYGDAKYGTKSRNGKLALWSYYLKFQHPVTKQSMVFKVFPPLEETPWKEFKIQYLIEK